MISWFSCKNRNFLSHRCYSNLSSIFTSISPRFSWIEISLKLLLSIIINPLSIFWLEWSTRLIRDVPYLFPLLLTHREHLLLRFQLGIIILEEYLFGILLLWFFLDFFFCLCRITIVTEIIQLLQVLNRCYLTDIIFYCEMDIFLSVGVSISKYFSIQVLINLFQFAFAQFFFNLVLLFPKYRKISILCLSFKLREMFFMKSLSL